MYLNTITTYVAQSLEIWLPKMLYSICDTTWHCIVTDLPFSYVFFSQVMHSHWLMSNVLTTTSHWWFPKRHFHFRPPSWIPDPYFMWILVTFTQVFLSISTIFKLNMSMILFWTFYLKLHLPSHPVIFLSFHFYCQLIAKLIPSPKAIISYEYCHE